MIAGCDDDSATGPLTPLIGGSLVSVSECGGFPTYDFAPGLPSDQTGVSWFYNGEGTLELYHLNAGFNCCPKISCRITASGSTITVKEIDEGMCECLCLTDALFHVTGLSPGTYNIKFEEPYVEPGDELLEFSITIDNEPSSGSFIVDRDHYPWHPPDPDGFLINFSDCGGFDSPRYSTDPPADSNCIAWEYSNNRLRIRHTNAIFNCCIDMLVVAIRVGPGVIQIAEDQQSSNPCYCDCPYDLDMDITDLLPGVYQVRVVNLYRQTVIDFTVDLINEPNGYYCYDVTMLPE